MNCNDSKNELDYLLKNLGLKKLPKKETDKDIWTKAICKVSKKDGSISYGLMKKRYTLENGIVLLLGAISPIHEILGIYPYEFLDNKYIQQFSDDSIDDRVNYLNSLELPYGKDKDFLSMSVAELDKEIICAAIFLQNK